MFATVRGWLLPLTTALLLVAGSADAADAGWVTLRNDTQRVVVVQPTATVNGQPRRCKPVRLLPGESYREYQSPPTLKVEVFDGASTSRSLYTGSIHIRPESQTFSVGSTSSGVTITPAHGH